MCSWFFSVHLPELFLVTVGVLGGNRMRGVGMECVQYSFVASHFFTIVIMIVGEITYIHIGLSLCFPLSTVRNTIVS